MEKKVFCILSGVTTGFFLLVLTPLTLVYQPFSFATITIVSFGLTVAVLFVLAQFFGRVYPDLALWAFFLSSIPLWIHFGGSRGPMPLVYVLNMVLINAFFRGAKLNIYIALILLLGTGLSVYEQIFPDQVSSLPGTLPAIIQNSIGQLLIFSFSFIAIRSIFNALDSEHEKVRIYAIELEKRNQELQELALRDRMTDLYNHHHTFEVLNQECHRARRHDYPLSIVMLDIDNFKKINDSFGHLAGDQVLIKTSEILKSCVRNVDIVGRYGGEEFLVVLPQTPLMGAVDVAERIRREFHRREFGQPMLRVTVSLGVAEYSGEDTEKFVDRADQELYRAKQAGRDQTSWSFSLV